jgi:hypothetical protein
MINVMQALFKDFLCLCDIAECQTGVRKLAGFKLPANDPFHQFVYAVVIGLAKAP